PLVPALRAGGDEGRPVTVTDPTGEVSRAFEETAKRIEALGPARIYRRELAVHRRPSAGVRSRRSRLATSGARPWACGNGHLSPRARARHLSDLSDAGHQAVAASQERSP